MKDHSSWVKCLLKLKNKLFATAGDDMKIFIYDYTIKCVRTISFESEIHSLCLMNDNDINDLLIKAIKRSCHCETDRNKKGGRWGIITYFNDSVNKLYSPDFTKLEEFIGTPIEVFNHNAINKGNENMNFMYLIASGLSPINDRITKIKNRVEELSASLPEAGSNKYVLSSEDGVSYSVMEERKKQMRRANQPAQINISDAFAKFKK